MSMTRFFSVSEIAELMGVKQDNVFAWIAARELLAVNVAAKRNGKPRWRISEEALEAFQASRSTKPKNTVEVQRRPRQKAADQPRQWIK